jgi:membrane-bound lytic murein transglycosylase B
MALVFFVWGGLSDLTAGDTLQKRVDSFRDKALRQGVSSKLVNEVLDGVSVNPEVLENRAHQPEFTVDYPRYRDMFVTPEMIEQGKKKLQQHRELLRALEERYGVPAETLVAIWGVESRYGTHQSQFDVLRSLYTLAFASQEGSDYFEGELLAVLKGLEQQEIPENRPKGSWAGAMGDPQFMPSSFRAYAVDHDGDGRKDIWNSPSDILASIAHYLSEHGWDSSRDWGRVTTSDQATEQERRIEPKGSKEAFRVTDNFEVLLQYNRSEHYALVVGELSEALADRNDGSKEGREVKQTN